MWQLHRKLPSKEWEQAGTYESITAATQRIIDLEEREISGIHLEMYVDPKYCNDHEVLGYFEYTGRRALYVVKRMVQ